MNQNNLPDVFQVGNRLPFSYFATAGVGSSSEGVPPFPYETFSFDSALHDAGISDFNVVPYTSVLPAKSQKLTMEQAKATYPLSFTGGAVLETIMAKITLDKNSKSSSGKPYQSIIAGIGEVRVWSKETGQEVIGFAAEHGVRSEQKMDDATAESEAKNLLNKSMDHELKIRGLDDAGKYTNSREYTVTYINVGADQYYAAIAALCFVAYQIPIITNGGGQ